MAPLQLNICLLSPSLACKPHKGRCFVVFNNVSTVLEELLNQSITFC